jgi:hypothetical protein
MNLNNIPGISSDLLKGSDLRAPVQVIIASAEIKELGKQKDQKLVIGLRTLQGQSLNKKLALNKSNALAIGALYGQETDAWLGKQITLFPSTTQFNGQQVACIRVSGPAAAAADPFGGAASVNPAPAAAQSTVNVESTSAANNAAPDAEMQILQSILET